MNSTQGEDCCCDNGYVPFIYFTFIRSIIHTSTRQCPVQLILDQGTMT